MKILCFSYGFSGCWWIRLKVPLEELKKKHAVFLTDGNTKYPMNAWDIVVFNNILTGIEKMDGDRSISSSNVQQMVEELKGYGTKIVYDTDDSQDIHLLHGFIGKIVDDNLDSSYFYLLKNADLITTTTQQLKDHLSKFTDKPIKVLPNCINPDLFPKRKQNDKVKIGYAGSFSHIPDFGIVEPAIKNLKRKHDIYFEILGFQYPPYKHKRPVPMEKYYQALADLGADIGICPLLDNPFNRNKSPLKFLEYAMTGTMTLASNRIPYKGELKDEWLVDDDKWEETLEKYILDKDLRERTLKEQQEWVLANRNIKTKVGLWEEAYKSILK